MAEGAQRVLGADVGIAVTGVAGPDRAGRRRGRHGVLRRSRCPGVPTEVVSTRLPGDRERLRQFSTISLLNLLRQRLDVLGRRDDGGPGQHRLRRRATRCATSTARRSATVATGERRAVPLVRPGRRRDRPKLVFQQVPESKVVKNRVHLDLIVGDDIEAEAARFVALGATRGQRRARSRVRLQLDRDGRPRGQRDLPLRQLRPRDARVRRDPAPPDGARRDRVALEPAAMPGARRHAARSVARHGAVPRQRRRRRRGRRRVRTRAARRPARVELRVGGADAHRPPASGADPVARARARARSLDARGSRSEVGRLEPLGCTLGDRASERPFLAHLTARPLRECRPTCGRCARRSETSPSGRPWRVGRGRSSTRAGCRPRVREHPSVHAAPWADRRIAAREDP